MHTTLEAPALTTSVLPRVVETSRGTAHPEHDRMRDLVLQSLLLRADVPAEARR